MSPSRSSATVAWAALLAASFASAAVSPASAWAQVIPPGLPGDPNSAPKPPRKPPAPAPRGAAAPKAPPSVQPPATPQPAAPVPVAPPGSPPAAASPEASPPSASGGAPGQPAPDASKAAAPSDAPAPAGAQKPAEAPKPKGVSVRFRRPNPSTYPGSKATFPKLEHWMNGGPIQGFEPGRIYAIEFFSTTCGHCKEAAPVVAELFNVFGDDVTFFGVTEEDPEKVKAWLAAPENAEKVHFPIVADPAREANKAFQYGTFKVSTPRIFIVKDGIVQWYGHPNGAQETIDALMDGTWDTERIRADFVVESCMERARDHMNEMRKEIEQTGDWSKLYRLLDSMSQALPERKSYFVLQKFGTLIGPDDKTDEGYALGREIVKTYADDIASLRTVARTILNSPWVQRRDLAFAHEVALAADALGQGKDSRAAEILALSWFSQGDREKALAEIDRAIALEPDPKVKAKYEAQKVRFTNDPPVPLASTPLKKGDEAVDAGHSAAPAVEVAPLPASPEASASGATPASPLGAPAPR